MLNTVAMVAIKNAADLNLASGVQTGAEISISGPLYGTNVADSVFVTCTSVRLIPVVGTIANEGSVHMGYFNRRLPGNKPWIFTSAAV